MSTDVNIVLRVSGDDAAAKIRGTNRSIQETGETAAVASGRLRGMGDALRGAFRESARGTLNDIRGLGNAARNLVGTLAAIGGGAGMGQLVTDSIRARDQMNRLGIEAGLSGGQMASTMRDARSAAERYGVSVNDITSGLQVWQDRFADLRTGTESMRDLAEFARASGEEMTNIVGVSGELSRQLGIPAAQMGDMLAIMRAQGQQGSITFGDISRNAVPLMAIEGAGFGQRGEAGLREVGAMYQRIATREPDAAMAATQQRALLHSLTDARTQRLMRSHHVQFQDAAGNMLAPLQIVQNVLTATGGDLTRIGAIFHRSEAKDAFLSFIEDFRQGGGNIRASGTALTSLLNVQVAQGTTTRDAATAMQSFEARLQQVRARLANIVDDRLMNRIGRLVDALPGIAEHLGTVLDAIGFAADHPVSAAAGMFGGRLALGMGGSLVSQLGTSMVGAFSTQAAGPIGTAVASAVRSGGAQHVFVTNWPSGGVGSAGGAAGPAAAAAAEQGATRGALALSMSLREALAANPLAVGSMVITAATVGVTAGTIIDELTHTEGPSGRGEEMWGATDFGDRADDRILARFTDRMNRERHEREQRRTASETGADGWHHEQLISGAPVTPSAAGVRGAKQDAVHRATALQGARRMLERVHALEGVRAQMQHQVVPHGGHRMDFPAAMATELQHLNERLAHLAEIGIVVTDSTSAGVNARTQARRHGRHGAAAPAGHHSVFRQMGPR